MPGCNWLRRCGFNAVLEFTDAAFLFTIPHVIEMRDHTIGVLQVLCLIAIFIYIFAFQLLMKNQYLLMHPAQGIIAFQIQQVRVTGNATFNPLSQCLSLSNTCLNVVKPASEMPYCCNSSCTYNFPDNPDQCTCPWTVPGLSAMYNCVWDDVYAVGNTRYPERLFVASYKRHTHQVYNDACYNSSQCRKPWFRVKTQQLYVAGVEDFVVRMDHTLIQEELNIARSANSMNGAIWVDGTSPVQNALCANPPGGSAYKIHPDVSKERTTSAPCMIPPDYSYAGVAGMQPAGSNLDVYYIRTLLQAAGQDLDSSSARVNGVSLSITIVYGNIYGQSPATGGVPMFGQKKPYYYYRVRGAFDSGYQELSVNYINETYRMLESPYGISINVQATGSFGSFDFLTASQVVVTGMALTGLTSVIVQMCAKYLVARKHYYKMLMKAPAFTIDMHENDPEFLDMPNKKLCYELQKRGLPTNGERQARVLRLHQAVYDENLLGRSILKDVCKTCNSRMIETTPQERESWKTRKEERENRKREVQKGCFGLRVPAVFLPKHNPLLRCSRHSCELPAPDRKCSMGCEYYIHSQCSKVCRNEGCRDPGARLHREPRDDWVGQCHGCNSMCKPGDRVYTCSLCLGGVCEWCYKACQCHGEELVKLDECDFEYGMCRGLECQGNMEEVLLQWRCGLDKAYKVCSSCAPSQQRDADPAVTRALSGVWASSQAVNAFNPRGPAPEYPQGFEQIHYPPPPQVAQLRVKRPSPAPAGPLGSLTALCCAKESADTTPERFAGAGAKAFDARREEHVIDVYCDPNDFSLQAHSPKVGASWRSPRGSQDSHFSSEAGSFSRSPRSQDSHFYSEAPGPRASTDLPVPEVRPGSPRPQWYSEQQQQVAPMPRQNSAQRRMRAEGAHRSLPALPTTLAHL